MQKTIFIQKCQIPHTIIDKIKKEAQKSINLRCRRKTDIGISIMSIIETYLLTQHDTTDTKKIFFEQINNSSTFSILTELKQKKLVDDLVIGHLYKIKWDGYTTGLKNWKLIIEDFDVFYESIINALNARIQQHIDTPMKIRSKSKKPPQWLCSHPIPSAELYSEFVACINDDVLSERLELLLNFALDNFLRIYNLKNETMLHDVRNHALTILLIKWKKYNYKEFYHAFGWLHIVMKNAITEGMREYKRFHKDMSYTPYLSML